MRKTALLVIWAVLSGCGAKSGEAPLPAPDRIQSEDARTSPAAPQVPSAGGAGAPAPRGEEGAGAGAGKTRKLVKRAELRLQAPQPDALETPVQEAMRKYGAYAASAEAHETSRYYAIRVPAGFYEPLLEELKALGRVLSRFESAEDVTLSYYDLESRLRSKEELRGTFRAYLGSAKTIEDIMAVETRLAEIQQEIEWMGTELRSLGNLVDYASITLWVQNPGAPVLDRPLLSERIAGVLNGFAGFASAALAALVGVILYGAPSLAAAALFYWLLLGRVGLLKKLWRLLRASGKGNKA